MISGWVCEADEVMIEFNGVAQQAAYGTERLDTAYTPNGTEICGDTDNGFGLLFNWNRLGDGEHTVVALVDGVELGRATVTVRTFGEEFLRGATGRYVLEDFPTPGAVGDGGMGAGKPEFCHYRYRVRGRSFTTASAAERLNSLFSNSQVHVLTTHFEKELPDSTQHCLNAEKM